MRAGRLRDRVTLRRQTNIETGKGGYTQAWTTVVGMERIHAEVIGQSGRESVIASTLQGVATYQINIRFRSGETAPQAKDQIIWHAPGGDVELNVIAPPVDRYGTRVELQIFADTSTPQGA
ncbi:MAG TPA: phage head closure protein [Allosphingosinicella sp.]|nr:phage head closure protein [Allosphingosinicella sp.]